MSTRELNTYITDAEWEVMRVVWANDRVTSKKVISVLKKKWAGHNPLSKRS